MKTLFLGGDKRQLEIINFLLGNNHEITLLGFDNLTVSNSIRKVQLEELVIREYDILIFPVSGIKEDYSVVSEFTDQKIVLPPDLLKTTKEKVLIFTGIKTECLEELLTQTKKETIVLMENEEVKKANSIPTVEGIIADLIVNTDSTINGSRVLVLGYGNVGTRLALILKALGASVRVGVLNKEQAQNISDYKTVITSDYEAMSYQIQDSDIIVNTVPELILNRDLLKKVNEGAYVLDISSYPYGVDFKTANELQIKNKLYLGIPGKVAPKTSGQILANEIVSILKRRNRI